MSSRMATRSGEVEAADKVKLTQRIKRFGQPWNRDGFQGVLSIRALLNSDSFDRNRSMAGPQLRR